MKILCAGILVMSAVSVWADTFGTGVNQFVLDFAEVGNAGNAASANHDLGDVGYSYRISKLEITVDHFLKARTADSRIGSGNENHWNDGTRTVGSAAPVAMASWYEAAMFANWLTTGDAYAGAYQFNGSGVLTAVDRAAAVSAYGTVYVLPSADEWFKAAFYRPSGDGTYSLLPDGTDNVNAFPQGGADGWNFTRQGVSVNPAPNYMWESGYGGEEQNGTFDMAGNVWEWTESAYDGTLDDLSEGRIILGGGATDTTYHLNASYLHGALDPANEIDVVGFRVAAIPEPSVAAVFTLTGVCMLFINRRFKS